MRADELFVWPVKTKTQVSVFIQQQSGSHHPVSPEYVLTAAMISDLVRCCFSNWFRIVLVRLVHGWFS